MADWYSKSRDAQLHLVNTWLGVFAQKAPLWNIPPAALSQLQTDYTAAESILAVVKSGARTPESVVQCNEAFKALESEARYIRRHFLLLPPSPWRTSPPSSSPCPMRSTAPWASPAASPASR